MKMRYKLGILFVSLIVGLFIFVISFQKNACAKFTGTSRLRAPIYTYEFKVSGKSYKGNFYQVDSKLSKSELNELDCIIIQYNSIIPWINRINDTKIVDK